MAKTKKKELQFRVSSPLMQLYMSKWHTECPKVQEAYFSSYFSVRSTFFFFFFLTQRKKIQHYADLIGEESGGDCIRNRRRPGEQTSPKTTAYGPLRG